MKNIIALLTLFLLAGLTNTFAQSFKVIVNNSNTVSSLTSKEVSDLFLKKKTKWPSGTVVVPVDLSSGSSVRENFSQKIHGKSTTAIRSFWQQAAFAGTASAPVEKSVDDDVIAFVKKTPGAIGYVSSTAALNGVKTINVE